jgi:serine protease
MARRRRITELTEAGRPTLESVFGPDDDNVVPGEVIFALEADAAAEVAISIPSEPIRRGPSAASVTELGSSAVDKALARLNVQSVTRVHGAGPAQVAEGVAVASDLGLDGTFRVRYGAARAPAAVAERLGGLNEVAWAEPNRYREAALVPNDPQFGAQWGLTRINCPDAWDHTTGDPSVVVAIVDTGVDLNHPELASLLVGGQDLVDFPPGSIPQQGWVFEGDFTGVDAVPQDEVGHGTHVAGTVCCASNNGVGVAGVAWNVRLMPVRVLARIRETATGRISGSGSAANIAAGIRWATDNGARVINMSIQGYGDTTVEREAVAYAISRGVVVVAAMGNDNTNQPSFPAAYPDVIAVGATDSADHRAAFSNFGPHIDVAAPGVGVQSTYWDDTYASLSGTSMATPHVAGVAALVLSRNTSLTSDRVGNIIRSSAKPLRDNPADPVPNDNYGSGLVQAGAAVQAAAPVVKTVQVVCAPSLRTPCPSRPIVCASFRIICQQSFQVSCQQSRVTCPTGLTCPSRVVLCQETNSPACLPVSLADCPSLPCPQSLACGSLACGGPPGAPGGQGEQGAQWEEYDPYGYDPYGSQYE